MAEFEHLFPKNTATPESYKYPHRVSSAEFKLPPRDDRVGHGQELAKQALAAFPLPFPLTPFPLHLFRSLERASAELRTLKAAFKSGRQCLSIVS